MRVLCAWCLKEGRPALMGEKAPLEDPTETHGLCPAHRAAVEAEIARFQGDAEAARKAAGEQARAAEEQARAAAALRDKVDP